MINSTEYRLFEQSDLSGGLNNSIDPTKLDAKHMIVMTNFYYDPVKNTIVKRGGIQKYMTTRPTNIHRAGAMFRFYRSDEPDLLVAGYEDDGGGGHVKYWKTASNQWNEFGGSNKPDDAGDYRMVQMNNIMIVCNGKNRPFYFKNDPEDRMTRLGLDVPQIGNITSSVLPGGNLSAGTYRFLMTYKVTNIYKINYEGPPFRDGDPDLTVVVTGTGKQIRLGGLPTTRPSYQEDKILIYRTQADLDVFYYDGQVDYDHEYYFSTKSDDQLAQELDTYDNFMPPIAKYPVLFQDRLFLAGGRQNVYSRELGQYVDIGTRSSVFFSKAGMPYAFPMVNYINLEPDDGDVINGLEAFAGMVFAFKPRKHFILRYSVDPLSGRIDTYLPGLCAERSLAVCGSRPRLPSGALMWLARDKRVYLHDGNRAVPVSEPIQATLNGISLEDLENAVAAWYPDRSQYHLSIDSDSDGFNDMTLVFDLDTLSWHDKDHGFAAYAYLGGAGDDNEFLGASLNDTEGFDVYQIDTSLTDVAAPINGTLTTPMLGFGGEAGIVNHVRSLYLEMKGQSGSEIQVGLYGDRETGVLQTETLTLSGAEGQLEFISLKVPPKRRYRLKITADDPDFFELLRYGFSFLQRRIEYTTTSVAGGIGPGEQEAQES